MSKKDFWILVLRMLSVCLLIIVVVGMFLTANGVLGYAVAIIITPVLVFLLRYLFFRR